MQHTTGGGRQQRSRTGCWNCRRKKKKCDEGKPTCFNCVKTSEKCRWGRRLTFLPQNAFTINEESGTSAPASSAPSSTPAEVHHDLSMTHTTEPLASPLPRSIARSRSPSRTHSIARLGDMAANLEPTITGPAAVSNDALALDWVNQSDYLAQPSQLGADFRVSPNILSDDGIFISGSAYQELHNTLRDHMFSTARSQDSSRVASPAERADVGGSSQDCNNTPAFGPSFSHAIQADLTDAEPFLEPPHEYLLWKNWTGEIADWLDKFDKERHFGQILPVMAKTCAHLRYSMLALSSRQLERKDGSIPASVTLSLYSTAVHLLVPQLHLRDTSVLASCVVICVLEMMSCNPKAWRRHLDGCACLVRSMGIRADSEGLERALFWCFIRMDVCGALISRERTLVPIDNWTSQSDFEADVTLFSSHSNVDWSAGYACYLLACVIDLLFASTSWQTARPIDPNLPRDDYADRWVRLFTVLESWYELRPPEMLPIFTQTASFERPFPTVLFGSGAAISGNQLHHTAAMLMLQNIARNVKRTSRHSMLWHARRVCGIAISNEHHGCWTNSIQPLWLAGQIMSHPTEHQAIVEIYTRIEKETGWGATWRANDLNHFWGDIE